MQLDSKHLEKLSGTLKKKVLNIHQGNIDFLCAIEINDLSMVKSLLEKDYPMEFNVFSQDEQYLLGDNLNDIWSDNIHDIAFSLTHNQGIKEENKELRNLLAEYWMYQKSIWYYLRKTYFSCSGDTHKSLYYANCLYKNMNYLHTEKPDWITGALYNKDNVFFDKFFEIHKQNPQNEQIFYPLFSSYFLQGSDKICYNFESWCKYYYYYFESAVEEKLNSTYYKKLKDRNRETAINEIFCALYRCFKGVIAPQFLKFLNEEYEYFFDIGNPDLIKVSIAWHDKIEFDKKKYLGTITSRRRTRSYTKENKQDILLFSISHALQHNAPSECEEFFKKINLDKSYYDNLTQYLRLSNQLNLKLASHEKQTKI